MLQAFSASGFLGAASEKAYFGVVFNGLSEATFYLFKYEANSSKLASTDSSSDSLVPNVNVAAKSTEFWLETLAVPAVTCILHAQV